MGTLLWHEIMLVTMDSMNIISSEL